MTNRVSDRASGGVTPRGRDCIRQSGRLSRRWVRFSRCYPKSCFALKVVGATLSLLLMLGVLIGTFIGGAHVGISQQWAHAWQKGAKWLKTAHIGALPAGAFIGGAVMVSATLVDAAVITYRFLAKDSPLLEGREDKTYHLHSFECRAIEEARPIDFYEALPLEDLRGGVAAMNNARYRRTMEDTHFAEELTLEGRQAFTLGVCDGHNGHFAANHVAGHFGTYLEEMVEEGMETRIAIPHVVDRLNTHLQSLNRNSSRPTGTTLTGAVYFSDHIILFNNGDSRTLLVRETRIYQTHDHDPNDKKIEKRLKRAPGTYTVKEHTYPYPQPPRGEVDEEERLMMQRVNGYGPASHIGGKAGKIPCWTDVTVLWKGVDYQEGDILVMASDGLYDVASSVEVGAQIFEMREAGLSPQQMAMLLADGALYSGSTDNTTVMVLTIP